MNNYYLEQAIERVPNKAVLINVVSKRVRQLNAGERSLVKPDSLYMEKIDIALKEIAEGKLSAEMVFSDSESSAVEHATEKVISLE